MAKSRGFIKLPKDLVLALLVPMQLKSADNLSTITRKHIRTLNTCSAWGNYDKQISW